MNEPRSFLSTLRITAPALATLWVVTLLSAGVTMLPPLRALSRSWDDQLFQPGGLMLLESLRLHRVDLLAGLKSSLVYFAAAQGVLLLARARLTAVLVDASKAERPRQALFSMAGSYVMLSLLKVTAIGIGAAGVTLLLAFLPPLEGRFPPALAALHGLGLVVGVACLGAIVCAFDTLRLALFGLPHWKARLGAARDVLRDHGLALLLRRAAWLLVSLATGLTTFKLATLRLADGAFGPLLTFVLTQMLVVLVLMTELWWHFHAQRALSRAEAPMPPSKPKQREPRPRFDTAGGAAEPNDPNRDLGARPA